MIDNDKKKKYYERLKSNIYVTRKSRINYSERLLKKGNYWNWLSFIYTIYPIGLSVLGMKQEIATENFTLMTFFLSVAISMTVLYANTMNYKGRSEALRYNYINLQGFYQELEVLDPENIEGFKKIREIDERYQEELKQSENHHEIDRLNAIRNDPQENHWLKGNCLKQIEIFLRNKQDIALTLFLTIAPPLLVIYIIF